MGMGRGKGIFSLMGHLFLLLQINKGEGMGKVGVGWWYGGAWGSQVPSPTTERQHPPPLKKVSGAIHYKVGKNSPLSSLKVITRPQGCWLGNLYKKKA